MLARYGTVSDTAFHERSRLGHPACIAHAKWSETTSSTEMTMKTLILTATLIATLIGSMASAHANRYIDPKAPFDAKAFFDSLPTGQ
jgi:hypothetical protein